LILAQDEHWRRA